MASRSLLPNEDDWDPMSADYHNPSFNNYTEGPGSRLDRQLQPFNPRYNLQQEYFLKENNFIGILNYLGRCTDVLGCMVDLNFLLSPTVELVCQQNI